MARLRVVVRNVTRAPAALTLLALEPVVPLVATPNEFAAREKWRAPLVIQSGPIEPGHVLEIDDEVGDPFVDHLDNIKWSAPENEGRRFELLELQFGPVKVLAVAGVLETDPAAVGVSV